MHQLDYLYVFFQSNLLELPIYYLFYRRFLSLKQTAILVTVTNSLTHTMLFFGFMELGQTYLIGTLLAESFAILGEAFVHSRAARMPLVFALNASFWANLVSWQLGTVLTYLIFF